MDFELPQEVAARYELAVEENGQIPLLGEGSYGQVFLGQPRRAASPKVALKRCFDCLLRADGATLKRTYRELAVLRSLSHNNVVVLLDAVLPKSGNDLYLVFPAAAHDLDKAIRYNLLDGAAQRLVARDLARALRYLHESGLIHRDIKPGNVLMEPTGARLCDFGLVRCFGSSRSLTEYVGMRWYRAPELLLAKTNYSEAVDIWAYACVVAEMALGRPLLQGIDAEEQLGLTVGLLFARKLTKVEADLPGIPPTAAACLARTKPLGQHLERQLQDVMERRGLDFLGQCLRLRDDDRPSALGLLRHAHLLDFWEDFDDVPRVAHINLAIDDSEEVDPDYIVQAIVEEVHLVSHGRECDWQPV